MVAFLRCANFVLETQDLCTILAHCAVHLVLAVKYFGDTFCECRNDLRMIVEVTGLDELTVWVALGYDIREAIDPVDQNAGEEEVREYDDAFVAEPGDVLEARFD